MAARLLGPVIAAEVLALALAFLVWAVQAAWASVTGARTQARLALARPGAAALVEGDPDAGWYSGGGRRVRLQALAELGGVVGGQGAGQLARASARLGVVSEAESWCASRRWWRRLHGVRLLQAVGGGEAVVPGLLGDPRPEVRAGALAWVGRRRPPELAGTAVAMLGDPDHACRVAARDAVLRLGRLASEDLLKALQTATGSALAATLEVARGAADPRFLAPALAAHRDPDPAVRARAGALAVAVAGPEAEAVVDDLLADPVAEVRAVAAAGVGTLGAWRRAPRLAEALGDPSFDVRREAGLALRRLGAPGQVYLRRGLRSTDPFAVDMARQVLDLPGWETGT